MPTERIPFVNAQESGSDQLAGASPVAVNAAIDSHGAVTRRPGIESFSLSPDSAFADPVVGLHATTGGTVYAATGSLPGAMSLWRLLTTGSAHDLTNAPAENVTASVRPHWAETELLVLVATGRDIRRIRKTDFLQRRLVDAPAASHVVAHSGRIIANNTDENKTRINYSGIQTGTQGFAGHEQWGVQLTLAYGPSGFFSAESRPDEIKAIAGNAGELRVFGETSTQTYLPDGNFIYAPVSALEFGIAAPSSVIPFDTKFAWLDHTRRLVVSDGRTIEDIGAAIQYQLDDMKTITDCFGYRVKHGPWDFLVWCFPTDQRTFAFQVGVGWSEWLGWDESRSAYQRFLVEAHTLVPGTGDNVVGTRRLSGASYVGDIGRMRKGVTTDLDVRIPFSIRTGFRNHGTDNRKHCKAVHLAFRRGEAASSPPDVRLRYRDEEGDWRQILVSLGDASDRHPVVPLRSLGQYRRRQWEISFHGTEDLTFLSATEHYEVLEA